jgi:hypothetical protein
MRRRSLAVCLLALAVAPAAVAGKRPVCANVPLEDKLAQAPVAFVGKLQSTREGAGGTYWRFAVDQRVKGALGSEVEIRAKPLTDIKGNALRPNVEVGVLAQLEGATVTTDSCGLSDPAALLSVADEARGAPIKLVIGAFALIGVLILCFVRLRRGSRPQFPGYNPTPK